MLEQTRSPSRFGSREHPSSRVRSWPEEVDGTWLGNPRLVGRADDFVRTCIAKHRGKPGGQAHADIAACSVRVLAEDVRSLGVENRWFWVTAASCQLAELLFAARSGGAFRDVRRPVGREAKAAFQGLLILRNAVFHPAHSSPDAGSGTPPIARLIDHLRGNAERALGDELARSWAFLAARPMATFAIRMLDSAAREHPDTKPLFRR